MLKGYNDRSFIGGTGPFFGNLRQRQKAQEDSLTSKIIDDLRCLTSQNIMQGKSPKSYETDSDDEYLSQNKKEIQKTKKNRQRQLQSAKQSLVISGKKVIVGFLKMNVKKHVAISV